VWCQRKRKKKNIQMSLQQLVNEFFASKGGNVSPQQFVQSASQLKTELLQQIQICFDKNQSIEDSPKLQELVTKFATFLSIYREAAEH
jgi:hypothetical protein